eukprot:EG_transcript_16705
MLPLPLVCLVWLVGALLRPACGGATQGPAQGFGSAKHALIIGCDGFGGLYLENATAFLPSFARLLARGRHTFRARNQLPTMSAPNWAAILTGQVPVESGVLANDWVPNNTDPTNLTVEELPPISGAGAIPEPLWAVAKQQWQAKGQPGKVAVAVSWDWLRFLASGPSVDFLFRGRENDQLVAQRMAQLIEQERPQLMFVHFDDIDEAGHASHWGSPKYYAAAKAVDSYIGMLLLALERAGIINDTLILVTADHGGWRNTHGQPTQACVYIPAVFAGPGIAASPTPLPAFIASQDFAPTVLHALGLGRGRSMRGRALTELFGSPDTPVYASSGVPT